jgi:large subunit ribosomal protein L15
MFKKKSTKASRMRGSHTHGWGHKKKHRGSGNRGGFGLAGTGARGDSQKPGLIGSSRQIMKKMAASKGVKLSQLTTGKAYFGKYGFKSLKPRNNNVLTLTYVEENFDKLVEAGIIQSGKNGYLLDATELGYDKVLGRGTFSRNLTLRCPQISTGAKNKVEAAGGSVEVTNTSAEVAQE